MGAFSKKDVDDFAKALFGGEAPSEPTADERAKVTEEMEEAFRATVDKNARSCAVIREVLIQHGYPENEASAASLNVFLATIL